MSDSTRHKKSPAKQTTTSSRKKSCSNCADAKARCNLHRPMCSRCQSRGLSCHYFRTASPSSSNSTAPGSSCDDNRMEYSTTGFQPASSESVQIGTRWLNALIAPEGKTPKTFTTRTIQYIARVLKSYSRALLKEDGAVPPIVHPRQSTVPQRPLANCRSLLRMWESRAPGSEAFVRETIAGEMSRLFEEHHSYDAITLLSACQSYLFYSIHLFFCGDSADAAMVDLATMIHLQELASAMSLTGLQTTEAAAHTGIQRPPWQLWIVAEAKRRTLYAMYMFENVFNFSHHTTSYIATELGHLPAPSSRQLWLASTEAAWEVEFDRYAAEWQAGLPLLEDLWPHELEEVVEARRRRADKWLEGVDEFGMFLFAVTSMTYGPP